MTSFKNILIHVDNRDDNAKVVSCGVELARHHQAKVKLVDILPPSPWPARFSSGQADHFLERLADAKELRLQQLAAEFEEQSLEVTYRVLPAPSSVAIIREAMRGEHDLVIKTVKGPESRRRGFFGTTAKRLLRKCPTPVLLIKPDVTGPFQHVVAAVDATAQHEPDIQLNNTIVQMAKDLCPATAAPEVLQVWSLYGESILKEHMRPEELEEARRSTKMHAEHRLDDLLIKFGMGVGSEGVHLMEGDPIDVIPEFVAKHATDLFVMGTVGRSGVAGFLMGNTAEQILERVSCSVLAVKPPGFKTPIRANGD